MAEKQCISPHAAGIVWILGVLVLGLDGIKLGFLVFVAPRDLLSYEARVGIPQVLGLITAGSLLVSACATAFSIKQNLSSIGRLFLAHTILDVSILLLIILAPQALQEFLLFVSNLAKA